MKCRSSGLTLLEAVRAKKNTLKGGYVKYTDICIKIINRGGKSSVLWSDILFYGDAPAEP